MTDLRGGSTVGGYPIPGKFGNDNKLARFAGNLLVDSLITDDGTNVGLPATTTIGSVTPTEISYLSGVTSNIQSQLNSKAPLASPAFTGTPTAPTPAVGDNSTKIATTAFVLGQAGTATPLMDGTASAGTSTKFAREDHRHPTDTTRAPLDSPAFTGTPTAPTAPVNTNTTQIATTAFVLGQAGTATPLMDGTASVGTSTRFAREDHRHPTDTTRAPLNSVATFTARIEAHSLGFNENATYIPHPRGASYLTTSSSVTGYIKITLPQSWTRTMMMFAIDVYNYSAGGSFTIVVAGFNDSATSSWLSCSAFMISSNNTLSYNVRFGHDGSKCAIYIGESSTTWSYPQINVRDFMAGYGNTSLASWAEGWSISITTSLGTVSSTVAVGAPASLNLPNNFNAKVNLNTTNGRLVLPVGTDKWAT